MSDLKIIRQVIGAILRRFDASAFLGGPSLAGALALTIPSLGLVQKYLGYAGAALYLVLAALAVALLFALHDALWGLLSERTALVVVVATFVGLAWIVLWLHPIYDATKGDANEALNLAARQLFHGHYPYYPRTQLGNVISPLPGAVFLAIPFVALGDSAYQNLFWLPLFSVACRGLLGSWRDSLLVLWAILALSPTIVQSLILGGDRVANTLFVMLTALLVIKLLETGRASRPSTLLAAVLLGVALSSRGNFLFVLPLVTATVARRRGWRDAVTVAAIVAVAFAAVTLPFYVYDPRHFTPIHQATKLHAAFPFARPLALVSTALLTLAFAKRASGTLYDLLKHAGIIQAWLFAWSVALFALDVQDAQYTFTFMKEGYGVHFLFFGVLAAWMATRARAAPGRVTTSPPG